MSVADELHKLDDLRTRGVISTDEFERAKARLLDAQPATPGTASAVTSLRRSTTDRWIGGVCGGLAKSLAIESWVLRLVFAVLFFLGGTGVLLYLLLWIFVPSE